MMRKIRLLVPIASLLLLAAACGGGTTAGNAPSGGGGGEAASDGGGGGGDLLAAIEQRGVMRASTDPAYPPQSSQNAQGEYVGFDIDVVEEIGKRLGVQVEYVTPSWDAITAGGWGGRWDIAVGSITITPERAKGLLFTTPYYYTPASIAVHQTNSDIQDLANDLDGKRIGVCGACSYESYLNKDLRFPGQEGMEFVIDDAQVQAYNTDTTAIQDLALGDGVRLDAVMSALPTLEGAIDNDVPIKVVGDPLFNEPLGVAVDKSSPQDPQSFFEEVDRIIKEMHEDGTLTKFSEKWYDGQDVTKEL
jgi:polar amino acid transport system substrate-binding protein